MTDAVRKTKTLNVTDAVRKIKSWNVTDAVRKTKTWKVTDAVRKTKTWKIADVVCKTKTPSPLLQCWSIMPLWRCARKISESSPPPFSMLKYNAFATLCEQNFGIQHWNGGGGGASLGVNLKFIIFTAFWRQILKVVTTIMSQSVWKCHCFRKVQNEFKFQL